MSKISLFDGIKEDKTSVLACFDPVSFFVNPGETICDFSESEFSFDKIENMYYNYNNIL